MNLTKWLYFVMEGQQVTRFHSRPGLRTQTDAEHQHGVALLCWWLSGKQPSATLLMAALTHDMAEQASSDISAPMKRAMGMHETLSNYEEKHLVNAEFCFPLSTEEQRILKIADNFEGMLYCIRERFLGNRYVNLMYWKWLGWARPLIYTKLELDLLHNIQRMWQWADSNEAPNFDVFAEEIKYGKDQGQQEQVERTDAADADDTTVNCAAE